LAAFLHLNGTKTKETSGLSIAPAAKLFSTTFDNACVLSGEFAFALILFGSFFYQEKKEQ